MNTLLKTANAPMYQRGNPQDLSSSRQQRRARQVPGKYRAREELAPLLGAGLGAAAGGLIGAVRGRSYKEEDLFLPGAIGALVGLKAGEVVERMTRSEEHDSIRSQHQEVPEDRRFTSRSTV